MKYIFRTVLAIAFLPILLLAAFIPSKKRQTLIWGSSPLTSNKYWSAAMTAAGFKSMTIMEGHYTIQSEKDFDKYFKDFLPAYFPMSIRINVGAYIALIFALRRGRVLHISYDGFALGRSGLWSVEVHLFRLAKIPVIVMPYGADAYISSRLIDPSLRFALLACYPHLSRKDGFLSTRLTHWNRHADVVIAGSMIDGNGRWDVTMNQIFVIDTDAWTPAADYSDYDGVNGPVSVMHTPNHRGGKGTEFLVEAIDRLKAEGLQIDFRLLEGVPNEHVRTIMGQVDILAEQFVYTGYALSGIEGMASGLPVLANLENETYTRVFRRYAFLNECPVLSTTPESIADNLRTLVRNPALRKVLGTAGRQYVEKYHSYATAQYLFKSIYDRVLDDRDVDLINLFHPLLSDYCRDRPKVQHPLQENRLPKNGQASFAKEADVIRNPIDE